MKIFKQSVYLQIAEDFKNKIDLGLLRENDRLASCRDLAMQMGINPNTVQRAYTLLENEGYIYSIPKKGLYVAPRDKTDYSERAAKQKINEIKEAGITRQRLISLANEIYGENDD